MAEGLENIRENEQKGGNHKRVASYSGGLLAPHIPGQGKQKEKKA
jgi:hypothetical protein